MKHNDVERKLINEALEDPETGWLSDLAHQHLEYNHDAASIEVGSCGSIDISHLAEIVLGLIND